MRYIAAEASRTDEETVGRVDTSGMSREEALTRLKGLEQQRGGTNG